MDLNILFTSVGRRGYLVNYFRDELKGKGLIHAANSDPDASGLFSADVKVLAPLINHDSYIPFLLTYCRRNKIDAVISLFDIDLTKLSRHKKDFEDIGVRVIISDPEVIDICNDKWKLRQFLNSHGFETLPSYISPEEAQNSFDQGDTNYPYMVKPRFGMGSIGLFKAENPSELTTLYHYCRKQISSTYLKYSAENHDNLVLIQQFCEGEEYNLDVINDLQGNYRATVVKKKIRMRCGETDCAETVKIDQLENLGESISRALKHTGNLDIDLILSKGKPYILDMNARFGGGYPFSHLAGVNLPSAIIHWLKGIECPENSFKVNYGVRGIKDIRILTI